MGSELEKTDLPQSLLEVLSQALADKDKVATLVAREKRYREHKYVEVERLAERIERAARTNENAAYCRCLDEMALQYNQKKTGEMTALSLFSGCGGFSLGFSAAGFLVKGYLELESDLRKIYKLNFPDSIELGGDITEINARLLANYKERIGDVDVIIGGPPCQGFSLSGKRQINDPRNVLFKHYLRFVDVFRPKVAVLENVRLLTSMKNPDGQFVKDEISEEFRKHGYHIKCFEINAKDYGIPQHRERVMFIAVRNDISEMPSLPEKIHGQALDMFSPVLPYRTFADACSDLAFIESGEKSDDDLHEAVKHPAHVIEWLWDVPEGCSAHENEDPNKRPPSGYNTTYNPSLAGTRINCANDLWDDFWMQERTPHCDPISDHTRSRANTIIPRLISIHREPWSHSYRNRQCGSSAVGIPNCLSCKEAVKFCRSTQPPG